MTKRKFSSFKEADAFRELQLEKLLDWNIPFHPLAPSDFFHENLRRLRRFDLTISEPAKELLVDAIVQEAIIPHERLKVWKSAPLASDRLTGVADYLVTFDRDYLAAPFLCLVEAKRDNFEKGLAQCLVEMKACRWNNEQEGKEIDVFGVVTNGEGWRFYKYDTAGRVWASSSYYGLNAVDSVLGILGYIFTQCESNL